ncbi:LysR family transcriptional regulator [Streptomyces griseocarneus]|uniref:LysR family transcriptional regulator n=1 Tax=Streptomyces griseocarneus TaxID=51201 RepID=UPI00167CCC10|nr:LysR family transcriptional regulator [Streptomyces griseocarneus]MBZ6474518.1 LysR family transcriptional regulator [Streptomyces griseocarneus]GHG67813.1 LysR family transcriptional regulator [Streptomyces griseocarneus]
MQLPDMNLLPALDALLREGSVTGAAARMNVSPSAMSRTLGRLRRVLDDPLLVPAGRGLALTPRALELRPRVEAALAGALAALRPAQPVDIAAVRRRFTLRSNDGMAVVLGPGLTERVAREAPGIQLRILPEGDEDPADLRDRVDLDLGHLPDLPHDVRHQDLARHHYVAVCRRDAPHADEPLTPKAFAAVPHITVSRRGRFHGVVDERLAAIGLTRRVLATVPTHLTACFLALRTDVLALVPDAVAAQAAEALPLAVREIPLDLPPVTTGMAWHVRLDTDPAHRWLRAAVARIAGGPGAGPSDTPSDTP